MRTIYLDLDFKCHILDDGTMTAVETDFFDGKCDAFIEGYRFVPAGESWVREDGAVFPGEMIAPWKDYRVLEEALWTYELQTLREQNETLLNDMAQLVEEIYRSDLEMMTPGVTADGIS